MTTSQNQEPNQQPKTVSTDGGAYIGGSVTAGGNVIGRDQHVQGEISS